VDKKKNTGFFQQFFYEGMLLKRGEHFPCSFLLYPLPTGSTFEKGEGKFQDIFFFADEDL